MPAASAQRVVDLVVASGIKAVLNFSPGTLQVPADVKLKSVDLTVSLESLSFYLARGESSRRRGSVADSGRTASARGMAPLARRRADGPRARWSTSATKPVTAREAIARGSIRMSARGARADRERGAVKKGDPLQAARLAGIMAAKQTSALIPLCHPLPLSGVQVELTPTSRGYDIEARVRTTAQTGVEMEALTAVAVAALTIYDMVKAVDKAMVIGDIRARVQGRRQERHYIANADRGSQSAIAERKSPIAK